MAVSPLVHPPGSSGNRTPRSKLAASNGATPAKVPPAGAESHDLAEQMNEEERNKYVKGRKLGEGTYANVFAGHLRSDPTQLVAIKKIKVQKDYSDGLPPDAIRELLTLRELCHPNIVALLAVYTGSNSSSSGSSSGSGSGLSLVLEYLPLGDLEQLIRDADGVRYGAADVKAWMGMLSRAVWFCHASFVLHRDIKPNNLLIARDGELKLADFGLARRFADPYRAMTSNVVTRWYRAPELLFGARHYSAAVDVWSVGLVFAELVIRRPYLPGDTEVHQVALICQALGTPAEDNWPGVSRLPEYLVPEPPPPPPPVPGLPPAPPVRGRDHYLATFGTAGHEGVDLLMRMLVLDPRRRITMQEVLEHAWWSVDPRPTRNVDLPRKGGGAAKVGEDLKRRPGLVDEGRGAKVARKLDFGAAK